ncbi:hypothetical protein DMENIID0001_062590 [Sergentomyia squamirostris]
MAASTLLDLGILVGVGWSTWLGSSPGGGSYGSTGIGGSLPGSGPVGATPTPPPWWRPGGSTGGSISDPSSSGSSSYGGSS